MEDLRRDVRRLRMAVWVLGGLATIAFGGLVWSKITMEETLRVQRLVIEDGDGRARVSLDGRDGRTRIALLDPDGDEQLTLGETEISLLRDKKRVAVIGQHPGGGSLVLSALDNDVAGLRAFAKADGGRLEATSQDGRVDIYAENDLSRIGMGKLEGPAFGHLTLEVLGGDTPTIRAVRDGSGVERSEVTIVVGESITKLDIDAPLGTVFIKGRDVHPEANHEN